MHMPEPDGGTIARRTEIAAALREIVPGEGVIVEEEELRAYETDGLTAYRQLPMIVVLPETAEAGRADRPLLLRDRCQDRAARRRYRALGRRAAARRRADARARQVQSDPRGGPRQPGRRRPVRRHQPRHHRGGRARRLLLRPRPVESDRLLHRRQRGRELWRRPLPQVRAHHQQPARPGDGVDDGRDDPPRGQAPGRRRLRPDGSDHRLRGAARRHHRGDGPHSAEAGDGTRAAHRLPLGRDG